MAYSSDIYVVASHYGTFSISETKAYTRDTCGRCGGTQMGVLAMTSEGEVKWLRCMSCNSPAVNDAGTVYPTSTPLSDPLGLPNGEARVWREIRSSLGVGAYTGAVMLCRKLLFHIATTHGLEEKKSNGFAPSFAEALNYLEGQELITSRMRPWVNRIKDVGNGVNHELEPVTPQQAMDVATFTEQLLRLAFEMDAIMARAEPGEEQNPASAS
jgi:hypothetical protein